MRAVILSLDTGAYKAKADVAAAASLKRMLEQVGIEVRAAKAFPEDKEMLKTVLCKLADAGMQMASHTWDHPDMTSLSDSEIEKTLSKTAAEMEKATGGTTPSALRPPYGAVDDNVKSQVNLPIILWSIDTLDWSSRDADAICQKVDAADPGDGDIILFHDIYESTADAVARLVPQLKAKGFQLVTVEQMFAAKNKELKNGTVYCDSYE